MKFFVLLALFALVAVSFAQPVDQDSAAAAAPEETKEAAPAAEGKDLETANSFVYGYPGYYGYGGYGVGYAYPYYGGYGGYGYVPAYGYGLYY